MKKLPVIITFLFGLILPNFAQEHQTYDLTIKVEGIENNKGKIYFAVYDSEKTFLKKAKGVISEIKDKKSVAIFNNLKKGVYAVSLFQDENNNKKLDTKIFGIPKEPYGFSNNATGFMGPPKFKDSKFTLESNKTITIKIN